MSTHFVVELPPEGSEFKIAADNYQETKGDWIAKLLESHHSDLMVCYFILFHAALTMLQLVILVFSSPSSRASPHASPHASLHASVHASPHASSPPAPAPGGGETALFNLALEYLFYLNLGFLGLFGFEQLCRFCLGGCAYFSLGNLFDLSILACTFWLQLDLKTPERQVAGLLLTFRLWRLSRLADFSHEARFTHGGFTFQNDTERMSYLAALLYLQEERNLDLEKKLKDLSKECLDLEQQLSHMLNTALRRPPPPPSA